MAPPLNDEQEAVLRRLYYDEHYAGQGRDRIFWALQEKYPELKVSRRQVQDWLLRQTSYQMHRAPPKRASVRPVVSTKAGSYVQVDLKDLQSTPSRGFKFLFVCVDA